MKKPDVLRVWARVLRGYSPFLSIEITKECPLHCPGCYAYSPDHLGQITTLRQLSDYRGEDLVNATLAVVRRLRPVHLSIIGENRWSGIANLTGSCRGSTAWAWKCSW